MDAIDLDVWIEAQQPPVYEEIREYRQPGDRSWGNDADNDISGTGLRNRAIREIAFSLAAQTALAWRYEKLLDFTKSQEGTLDRIANFAPFVVDEHMLVPSITETRDRFEISKDSSRLREVRIQYLIDEPARAVTEAPTWRDYIWREFRYPEEPDRVLWPRTETEVLIWEDSIDDGWDSGLQQAHYVWENNLNELVRDIRGRVTFRVLEARDIVRTPIMSRSVPENTESGDRSILNAGDTIYSVTVPVNFQSQDHWKALWVSLDEVTGQPAFEVNEPSDLFGAAQNLPNFGEAE